MKQVRLQFENSPLLLFTIWNMALLLQSNTYKIPVLCGSNKLKRLNQWGIDNSARKLFEWLDSHVENFMVQQPVGLNHGQYRFAFRLGIPGGEQVCFRGQLGGPTNSVQLKGSVCTARGMVAPRSSELNKLIGKLVPQLNNYGSNLLTSFLLHPHFGQLQILQTHKLLDSTKLILLVKSRIDQAMVFLNNFLPSLLYQANLISFSELLRRASPFAQNLIWSRKKGELHKIADMVEILPLVNVPIRYEDGGRSNEDEDVHDTTCQNIVNLLYKQSRFKDLELFAGPPKYLPPKPINQYFGVEDVQKMMRAPVLKDGRPEQGNQIENMLRTYNTIQLKDWSQGRPVAQGGWANIEMMEITFKYMPSLPSSGVDNRATTISEEESNQIVSGTIKRAVFAKVPKESDHPHKKRTTHYKIRYQKQILEQFRGAKTKLMTKYFHTAQTNFKYNQYLLMDYVPGKTVIEECIRQKNSLSFLTKVFWLLGAVNGVKFLEDYEVGHMDLSPNNLMVCRGNQIKMIDFGQAYHPLVSKRFIQRYNKQPVKWTYSPGRTFPYAPPQTSLRNYDLGSQQDVFSLGVLAFYLAMGYTPLNCSNQLNERIYQEGSYLDRMFFAAEQIQDVGSVDVMSVFMTLAFRMMSVDQKRRPLPIWLHILMVKFLDTLPR